MTTGFVIGIDVQAARDCPYAVLDSSLCVVDCGWFSGEQREGGINKLLRSYPSAVFAIDAPRKALPSLRTWEWDKKKDWQRGAGRNGRHCEVVIKAFGLANPQWTPLEEQAPTWMLYGFGIFGALEGRAQTLEVFPSASYRMLNEEIELRVNISLAGFLKGPKDMLDAVMAAVTGHEFLAGRGEEVGGGDGLGSIVLPRPILDKTNKVLKWPE